MLISKKQHKPYIKATYRLFSEMKAEVAEPQVWNELLIDHLPKRFILGAVLLFIGLIVDLVLIDEVSSHMLWMRLIMVIGALGFAWASKGCKSLLHAESLIVFSVFIQVFLTAYVGYMEGLYTSFTSEVYQTLVFVLIFLSIRSFIYASMLLVVGLFWFLLFPLIFPFFEERVLLRREMAGYLTYSVMLVIGNQMFLKYRMLEVKRRTRLETRAKRYFERASHDALTGLYNFGHFEKTLPRQMEKAKQEQIPMYLCLIDLDDFKHTNDSHGHLAGNQVLKNVAAAITGSIRQGDEAFRLGGDEFAVILFNVSKQGAENVTERIKKEIAAPMWFEGAELPKTRCSVGMVGYSPAHNTLESFIKAADELLYQAKSSKVTN